MSGSESSPLVWCLDPDDFDEVRRSDGAVPVFGLRGGLRDAFPPDLMGMNIDEWRAGRSAGGDGLEPAVVPGGVSVAFDEPHCAAVARLLADRCRRRLVVARADQWGRTIRTAVEAADGPVCAVIPLWRDDGTLDPTLLEETADAVRVADPWSEGPSWGVVTGPTPMALSAVAAKALMPAPLLERWAGAPAALCLRDGSRHTPFPRWPASAGTPPVSLFDAANLDAQGISALTTTDWSALVFAGHGRSYCGCDGFLCGARAPTTDSSVAPASCVRGLDCINASFPRIDPRRYSASTLLLDTCGAANTGAVSWSAVPALAIHATLGPARGVIASDGNTVRGDPIDALRAFATTPTLGAATAVFNHARRDGNIPVPYLLLGDPAAACWPSWSAWQSLGRTSHRLLSGAALFVEQTRRPPGDDAAAAIRAALAAASHSAWPWELWPPSAIEAELDTVPCPVCGRTPTVLRHYRSRVGRRAWRDCRRCAIVADGPDACSAPVLRLAAPAELCAGEHGIARITVDDATGQGAAALVLSGRDQNVRVSPDIVTLSCAAGGAGATFELVAPPVPATAHSYYLRAIVLVDGAWLWASRPLTVRRARHPAAALAK